MSTEAPASTTNAPEVPRRLKVVGHSGLLYWWPVWLVGFLLAGATYIDGTRLAVVPSGTTVEPLDKSRTFKVTVAHPPAEALDEAASTPAGQEAFPVRISQRKGYGIVYFTVILLVVFASNMALRGVASLLAVLVVVLVVVLFSFMEWWTPILSYLGGLHIQISVAGYLLPSVALLIMWVAAVFLYDPLRYADFTAGQVTLVRDIGDQQEVYDTAMIHVEKEPTNILCNWILGLGSGNILITIPARGRQIELTNVLFVDHCMAKITELIKTKAVIEQAS
jgi:hypothetical protein